MSFVANGVKISAVGIDSGMTASTTEVSMPSFQRIDVPITGWLHTLLTVFLCK